MGAPRGGSGLLHRGHAGRSARTARRGDRRSRAGAGGVAVRRGPRVRAVRHTGDHHRHGDGARALRGGGKIREKGICPHQDRHRNGAHRLPSGRSNGDGRADRRAAGSGLRRGVHALRHGGRRRSCLRARAARALPEGARSDRGEGNQHSAAPLLQLGRDALLPAVGDGRRPAGADRLRDVPHRARSPFASRSSGLFVQDGRGGPQDAAAGAGGSATG